MSAPLEHEPPLEGQGAEEAGGLTTEEVRRLRRLERLAAQLDESIRIPGIGYRIGYDALVGLIPGVGDVAGLVLGSYIVLEAARFRLPRITLLRMAANVAVEAVVGAIPIVGDVFDAVYKANLRNIRLLRRRLDERGSSTAGDRLFFAVLFLVPAGFVIGLLALLVYLISLL